MALPAASSAEEMTWTMTSEYEYKVQVEFYSQDHKTIWPGHGNAYALNDSAAHKFSISCEEGEKICYGAWATGDSSVYWGVGLNNRHDCESCCAICGEKDPVKRLVAASSSPAGKVPSSKTPASAPPENPPAAPPPRAATPPAINPPASAPNPPTAPNKDAACTKYPTLC